VIIYFALLVGVTMVFYVAYRTDDTTASWFIRAFAFASLVLFSGLRNGWVGTDGSDYVRRFNQIQELADVWHTTVEPGIAFLSWAGKFIYNDYIMLFTMAALIIAACFLFGIHKLSVSPVLSVFVLLASGAFFFQFNGLRQGIAIAIFFLAIAAIYQRRLWVFLICIAVACFFHTSAIVCLPTYFMVPRKNDLRYNVLVFSLVVVSLLLFSALVNMAGMLNARYSQYGGVVQTVRGRGLVYASFLFSVGVFLLYFKRYIQEYRPLYDFLLNLYLLGLVIVATSVLRGTMASGIMRLSGYFTPSQVLLWPIVFTNVRDRGNRGTFLAAFAVLYLVYYGMTLQAFGNIVPYALNPLAQDWFATLF
jgi:hypothetical protein